MKYITIERNENIEEALIKLENNLGNLLSYYTIEKPVNLFGNYKILTLRKKPTTIIYAKVDGPGFIIDELYKKFL